jgi:cyanophycinase-like exopeptidase
VKGFGVTAEWIPADLADPSSAKSSSWAEKINSGEFSCIYFTGGDQSRYTSIYNDTVVLSAIRSQFFAGKLGVMGSSAGTMI